MAQTPDFLSDRKSVSRWAGVSLADSILTNNTKRRAQRRFLAGSITSRQKISGLRLGERKLLQMVVDWVVVTGGALIILSQSDRHYAAGSVAFSLLALSVLWLFFADALDAYKVPIMQKRFHNAYSGAKVLLVTITAYVLLAWLTGGFLPIVRPRISEMIAVLLLIVPLLIGRAAVSSFLSHAPLKRRVVVVGANQDGLEMVEAITRYDGNTYEFLGYFDDTPSRSSSRKATDPLALPTTELLSVNDRIGIDQIVLANPLQTGPLVHTLSLLHERGTQITPMFALYQDLTGRVPVSHLGDDYYVALTANIKATARTYRAVKRVMDMALALLMLLVTSPILPLIALAIRLDTPGPIFFKQVRVGRGGKIFKIMKFRSMRQDAEANTGAVWAIDGDSRITRVGRFLRKSRLDEIPQLWNVLVGDMSFVGPRPERPEFDEELEREIPFYRARRAVRPGLTGWAQVSYGYGNTLRDALRKVEYDLYYIKNESLYLDLLIMLRTVSVVLKLGGK
jgi:exopolysaccharide biosynthesis polyprenyl glycosylphosphotransferase